MRSFGKQPYLWSPLLALVLSAVNPHAAEVARAPETSAASILPSSRQVRWQRQEFITFVHFGPNTFTGREWGTGKEDPAISNPTDLDCRQWARLARDAGARGLILVAKHHDGFCLWPSAYTDFSVKRSPWRGGKGDLVREMSEACREFDLSLGIYLSPADLHEPTYGTDPRGYNDYFKNQLRELLTNYGEISEVFFDGAQPAMKAQTYDYAVYFRIIRELRPNAVISVKGPDVRWVGNEMGVARESEWSVIPLPVPPDQHDWPDLTAKDLGSRKRLEGARYLHWYPAEADVCLGDSWFHHVRQDDSLKSLQKLVDIYFNTVGRNAVLLLNLSPDKRGLIPDPAAARLHELGEYLRSTFSEDLVCGARVAASNTRSNAPMFSAQSIIDTNTPGFWMADDNCGPVELEFNLPRPRRFNVLMLQEHIETGQRVEAFALDVWQDNEWKEITRGTTIGYKRLLRFEAVEVDKLRLRILESRVCPTLARVGLFRTPEQPGSRL